MTVASTSTAKAIPGPHIFSHGSLRQEREEHDRQAGHRRGDDAAGAFRPMATE
jgi:hypothetical protein